MLTVDDFDLILNFLRSTGAWNCPLNLLKSFLSKFEDLLKLIENLSIIGLQLGKIFILKIIY